MQYIIIETYSLKLCIYSHTYRILMWKLESLKENARERKQRKKVEEKKKWRKFKHKFEVNKLFLYTTLNLFTYLILLYKKLNNFKIYKFLNNFNYIWKFFFHIFHSKIKYEKIIFFSIFFPYSFWKPNITHNSLIPKGMIILEWSSQGVAVLGFASQL